MIEIEANKYAITDDNWFLLSQNYYVKVSRTGGTGYSQEEE